MENEFCIATLNHSWQPSDHGYMLLCVSLRITLYLSIFIKHQVDHKKEEETLVYGSSQCYIAL